MALPLTATQTTPKRATASLLGVAASLLALTACTPHVQPLSPKTIAALHRKSVPSLPSEFRNGQWLTEAPPLQLPAGSEVRLPLQTLRELPSIELNLNGQPLPWFIDTGASFPIVLDATSAQKASLPLLRHSRLTGSGVGGSAPGLLARFDSLALESTPVLQRGLALVLLHQYQLRFAGISVEKVPINLLGLPLLERFSYLTFDAHNQELRLGFQRPYRPSPNAASFPFETKEGRLWVTLRIGTRPIRAFFDSGYAANLRLPSKLASSLPQSAFEFWEPEAVQRQLGIGGIELDSVGRLREATLGSVTLRPLSFHASSNAQETILGWGPFRNLKTTIDFQRKRVWVER